MRTATVSIGSDDDNENPYTFVVEGYGKAPVGAFSVTYDGNTHTSGTASVGALSPYEGGATVIVLNKGSLVKDGYAFTGWNTAQQPTHARIPV